MILELLFITVCGCCCEELLPKIPPSAFYSIDVGPKGLKVCKSLIDISTGVPNTILLLFDYKLIYEPLPLPALGDRNNAVGSFLLKLLKLRGWLFCRCNNPSVPFFSPEFSNILLFLLLPIPYMLLPPPLMLLLLLLFILLPKLLSGLNVA
jgi:hypothetical protein